jgi:hypothetical protein
MYFNRTALRSQLSLTFPRLLSMIKMYMDSVTEAYKNKIGERITLRLIRALKDKEITQAELATISSYILENIDEVESNSDILEFLEEIAKKWPFLSALVSAEHVEETDAINKQKIAEVGTLLNQNKIDEALKVATDANNQENGGQN